MSFKVGDKVSVLDDNTSGVIINIDNNTIYIETEDGFEFQFQPKELIINKNELNVSFFSNQSIDAVIEEKEASKKRKVVKVKTKERSQPQLEVDLHIHHLTNSTRGMTKHDLLNLQLDTAKRQLEFAIRKRIQKIVFIHGVGEGILKIELEYLFSRYNNVKFYDADYKKYGVGATEVYVFQNIEPN